MLIVRLLSVPPDVSCSSALLPVHLCQVALVLLLSAVQPPIAAVVVVWCAADLSLEYGLAVDSHELERFPAAAAGFSSSGHLESRLWMHPAVSAYCF